MPRRTPSPSQRPPQPKLRPEPRHDSPHRSSPPETVDPRWIIKGLLLVLLAALACGYLSLCLLFYVGQWQIVLHPKRTTGHPETLSGSPIQFLSFAPDESAVPQLTAWSIAASPGSHYANVTLLYLPSGDGSLADATATLSSLHDLGINIFAIDYRGYGQSSHATHPSAKVLMEDANAAWQYLRTARGLSENQIIPYGTGVGASLAVHLAENHPAIQAIILDDPHTDLLTYVLRDDRTKLLPARLLFHERFPLAAPLSTLHTPKLLLSGKLAQAFQTAAEPRITVEFNDAPGNLDSQPGYIPSVRRFLDLYLAPAPAPDLKSPARN